MPLPALATRIATLGGVSRFHKGIASIPTYVQELPPSIFDTPLSMPLQPILDHSSPVDYEAVTKIVQRFEKTPVSWPRDDQPFGICRHTFIGNDEHHVLAEKDIHPLRAFSSAEANGRRAAWAHHYHSRFSTQSPTVFDHAAIAAEARTTFESVCQAIHRCNFSSFSPSSSLCSSSIAWFDEAVMMLSCRQHDLFDLTRDDIIGFAPGVMGPIHRLSVFPDGDDFYLAYSVLCCALYKKDTLYSAVRDVQVMSPTESRRWFGYDAEMIDGRLLVPSSYGYQAPRLIMVYITFAHKILAGDRLDHKRQLAHWQFVVA